MAKKMNLIKLIALATAATRDRLPPERKWQGAVQANYWARMDNALEKGEPVNWGVLYGLPEIFYAMGIPTLMHELLSAAIVNFPNKLNERYIDIAQENLVADHVCSYMKIMVGATLSGDLAPPATIVHPIQICDSSKASYAMMAHLLEVPHFALDVPNTRTLHEERTIQYIADELERMVDFLEEHTGKKLEDDKLREVMEYSNTAYEYNLKVNELLKMVPSPLPETQGLHLLTSAGTPECAEYYRKTYELGKAIVESGEGYMPDQRFRLAWFSTQVNHDLQLFNWLREKFGSIVVNTMLGTITSSPAEDISSRRKIMEALARKQMDAPMTRECWGGLEHWLDYAIPVCQDWKIDAVILTLHLGCKNMWAVSKLLKDRIADEMGIPTLVVESDSCDGRVFSSEGIRAQISDFFNTMLL